MNTYPKRTNMKLLCPLLLLVLCCPLRAQDMTPTTELADGEQHLLFKLPYYLAQPDGMAVDSAGNVYVSNPNFSNQDYPAVIFKVTPEYAYSVFATLPAHPKTKMAGPMGMSFGPDGNLYVGDNQYTKDKDYQSRILRVNMQDGKPQGVDVVAKGLKHPNALRWHDGALYVTDTKWELDTTANTSGIWRFTLEEMTGDSVLVEPTMDEAHLIDTFTAIRQPNGKAMGTDGMDFDSQGNLFVGMFSDGRVFKLTMGNDGKVESKEVFVEYGTMPSCDGVFIDKTTDNLFIADSEANAIRVVTPDGQVSTLAENGDTDGSDGKMDQPCEPLLIGNKLFVANYDQPFPGFVNTGYDKVHNMTIIQVPAKYLTKQ